MSNKGAPRVILRSYQRKFKATSDMNTVNPRFERTKGRNNCPKGKTMSATILETRLEALIAELAAAQEQQAMFKSIDVGTPLPKEKGTIDIECFANQFQLSLMLMLWASGQQKYIPAKKMKKKDKWRKLLTKYNDLVEDQKAMAQLTIDDLEKEVLSLENRIANKDNRRQWKPIKVEGEAGARFASHFARPSHEGLDFNGISESLVPDNQKEEDVENIVRFMSLLRRSVKRRGNKLSFEPRPELKQFIEAIGWNVSRTGRPTIPMLNEFGEIVEQGGMQGVDLMALLAEPKKVQHLIGKAGYVNCGSLEALFGAALSDKAWGFPIAGKFVQPAWWLFNMAEWLNDDFAENSIRVHSHEYLSCWSATRTGKKFRFGKDKQVIEPRVFCTDLSMSAEDLMVSFDSIGIEYDADKVRTWRGAHNPDDFQVDGMMMVSDSIPQLLGTNVKRPFQMRAIHQLTVSEVDLLTGLNQRVEEETREAMHIEAKKWFDNEKNDVKFYESREDYEADRNETIAEILNGSVAQISEEIEEHIKAGRLRYHAANLWKGLAICCEGMIKGDVILMDLNCGKGRAMKHPKEGLKAEVSKWGIVELPDMIFGLLQDHGMGHIRLSWQAVLYLLEEYKGRYPYDMAIASAHEWVLGVIEEIEQGRFGKDFKELLDILSMGDDDTGETEVDVNREVMSFDERKLMALWNFKATRLEIIRSLRDFLRDNAFLFITDGMKEQDMTMPNKMYGYDLGFVPKTIERDGKVVIPVVYNGPDAELYVQGHWGAMFRHPVASKECHGPAQFINAKDIGLDWLPWGYGMHPWAIKHLLGADTDGDTFGGYPLNLDHEGDEAIWEAISKEVWQVIDANSKPERAHVETVLGGVKTSPRRMLVGVADEITGKAASSVGSAALLSAIGLRFELYLKKVDSGLVEMEVMTGEEYNAYIGAHMELKDFGLENFSAEERLLMARSLISGAMKSVAKWHWPLMEGCIQGVKKDVDAALASIELNIANDTNKALDGGVALLGSLMKTDLKDTMEKEPSFLAAMGKFFHRWLMGLGVVNEEGHLFAWSPSALRMSDMEKVQNPNLIAADLWDNRLWGIMEPSLDDSLGKWRAINNDNVRALRERVKPWVTRLSDEEYKKDPKVVTHWNRSHVRQSRAFLFPQFASVATQPEERERRDMMTYRAIEVLAQYYRVASVKRVLSGSIKPTNEFPPKLQDSMYKDWRYNHFRRGCDIAASNKDINGALFMYMIIKHYGCSHVEKNGKYTVTKNKFLGSFYDELMKAIRECRKPNDTKMARWNRIWDRCNKLYDKIMHDAAVVTRDDSEFLWMLQQTGLINDFAPFICDMVKIYSHIRGKQWKTMEKDAKEDLEAKMETFAQKQGLNSMAIVMYKYLGGMIMKQDISQQIFNACASKWLKVKPILDDVNQEWNRRIKEMKEVIPARVWHLAWYAANDFRRLAHDGEEERLLALILEEAGMGSKSLEEFKYVTDGSLAAHALYNLDTFSQMGYDPGLMRLGMEASRQAYQDRRNGKKTEKSPWINYNCNPWTFLYTRRGFKKAVEEGTKFTPKHMLIDGCYTVGLYSDDKLLAFIEGNSDAPVVGRALLAFDHVKVNPNSLKPVAKYLKANDEFRRWNDDDSNAAKLAEALGGGFTIKNAVVWGENKDAKIVVEKEFLEWRLFSEGEESFVKNAEQYGWEYSLQHDGWSKRFGDTIHMVQLAVNETDELQGLDVTTEWKAVFTEVPYEPTPEELELMKEQEEQKELLEELFAEFSDDNEEEVTVPETIVDFDDGAVTSTLKARIGGRWVSEEF